MLAIFIRKIPAMKEISVDEISYASFKKTRFFIKALKNKILPIILKILERFLRLLKISSLKLDNLISVVLIPKIRESYKNLGLFSGHSKFKNLRFGKKIEDQELGESLNAVPRFQLTDLKAEDGKTLKRKEKIYLGVLKNNPRDALAYAELGKIYFASNNINEAKICLEKAQELGSEEANELLKNLKS